MFVAALLFYGLCAIVIAFTLLQIFYWHIMCPCTRGRKTSVLMGRRLLLPGGNTGIGFETSKNLFRRGARVIMICLDQGQGEEAVKELKQEFRGIKNVGQASAKQIDLASLVSVRLCIKELIAEERRIDLLVYIISISHINVLISVFRGSYVYGGTQDRRRF
jgi:enoyl-[acyl-carrier-protein] reductase (NADH)